MVPWSHALKTDGTNRGLFPHEKPRAGAARIRIQKIRVRFHGSKKQGTPFEMTIEPSLSNIYIHLLVSNGLKYCWITCWDHLKPVLWGRSWGDNRNSPAILPAVLQKDEMWEGFQQPLRGQGAVGSVAVGIWSVDRFRSVHVMKIDTISTARDLSSDEEAWWMYPVVAPDSWLSKRAKFGD